MIEGHQFLYQALDGIVYHINKDGVRAVHSWSSNDEIVAFVDGDEGCDRPNLILRNDKVQIILTTSPEGANKQWVKQEGSVEVIVTEPWSADELFMAGFVLRLLLSMLD